MTKKVLDLLASTKKVLDLADKAASYKRGGNHLLKAIQEVEEVLINLFGEYTQFRFIYMSLAYVGNVTSSNVGDYGAALCYALERGGHREFKPMPSTWASAGDGFYLHNDFHVWINKATRAEVVKVAENLPAFLNSLADFLEGKGALNDKSATEIQKIAANLRTATK